MIGLGSDKKKHYCILRKGPNSTACQKKGPNTAACQKRVIPLLLVKKGSQYKTSIVWVACFGALVGNWWLRWWIRWQRAYWLYRAQLVAPFLAWLEIIGFALVSWVLGTNRHFLPLFFCVALGTLAWQEKGFAKWLLAFPKILKLKYTFPPTFINYIDNIG